MSDRRSANIAAVATGFDLPEEVSLAESAAILGVDKHTVKKYIDEGLLEWRNVAPPSSARPTYRVTLRSVVRLRTTYRTGPATLRSAARAPRRNRAARTRCGLRHINLRD